MEYIVSPEMQKIAEKVIEENDELKHLRGGEVRIGYQLGNGQKKHGDMYVFGDCTKASSKTKAFSNVDFVITFLYIVRVEGADVKSGNWSWNFTDLPKCDADGEEYNYTISEDAVGNYYEASVATGLAVDGNFLFTVTNYRETDENYETRTGSVRGANRNKPSSGDVEGTGRGVAGAGRGRGTGDDSNMVVYGEVFGASILALIAYVIAARRKKRGGK